MLEKQKFEPGSVGQKIESTLHSPALERTEIRKAEAAVKMEKPSEVVPQTVAASEEVVQPFERKVRAVKKAPAVPVHHAVQASPSPKVKRVRSVKSAPPAAVEPLEEEPAEEQPKKARVVRKVKR